MAETTISEKLKAVSDNVPKVYEAGRDVGKNEEWSRFWDSYQQNGKRTDYRYAFGGKWDLEAFRPKYDIVIKDGGNMFNGFAPQIDLEAYLKELGVGITIALLKGKTIADGFFYSGFTALPTIDLSLTSANQSNLFAYAYYLKKIEKIILGDDGTQQMTKWFSYCNELEEIRFEGKINCDVDIHWSTKLSADSIYSIFNALSDDVTEKTATFPSTAPATVNALPANGDASFAIDYWETLVNEHSNWTIVLQ